MDVPPYPHEALRRGAREIAPEEIDEELRALAEEMVKTMYERGGVGLAAPQVGISRRLICYDLSEERNQPQVLLNPRVVERSGRVVEEEGCLSVPGVNGKVKRAARVVVEGLTLEGEAIRVEAEGLAARMFQHECDHLDGVLFCDRLGPAKRLVVRRILRAMEKAAGEKPEP